MHAGTDRVSVIHQTVTWTTWSLTCVRNHSYACVCIIIYKRGLGTPTASQHNIFDLEKLSQSFLVLLTGFELRVFGSWVRCCTQWASPSPWHLFIVFDTLLNRLHAWNVVQIRWFRWSKFRQGPKAAKFSDAECRRTLLNTLNGNCGRFHFLCCDLWCNKFGVMETFLSRRDKRCWSLTVPLVDGKASNDKCIMILSLCGKNNSRGAADKDQPIVYVVFSARDGNYCTLQLIFAQIWRLGDLRKAWIQLCW